MRSPPRFTPPCPPSTAHQFDEDEDSHYEIPDPGRNGKITQSCINKNEGNLFIDFSKKLNFEKKKLYFSNTKVKIVFFKMLSTETRTILLHNVIIFEQIACCEFFTQFCK